MVAVGGESKAGRDWCTTSSQGALRADIAPSSKGGPACAQQGKALTLLALMTPPVTRERVDRGNQNREALVSSLHEPKGALGLMVPQALPQNAGAQNRTHLPQVLGIMDVPDKCILKP